MKRVAFWLLTAGLLMTGSAGAQDGAAPRQTVKNGQNCMRMQNCICHMTGVVYQTRNLKDGVVLTMTSKDPETVKKLQDQARIISEMKDISPSGGE